MPDSESPAPASLPVTEKDLPLPDGLLREFLLHHRVCPIGFAEDGTLVVGVAPNAIRDAVDEVAYAYRARIAVEERAAGEIERLIERLATRAERAIELTRAGEDDDDERTADVRDLANQPPVWRYLNLLVGDAAAARASDIHLESSRNGVSARVRIDGVLQPTTEPPAEIQQAIILLIKLLAELDTAERRRPQDGRIRVRLESRELDLRVSTVPTHVGESIALRLCLGATLTTYRVSHPSYEASLRKAGRM
jgi:general secretion pathway protein E